MGGQNEGDRFATEQYRRSRRKGNWADGEPLHYPRRSLRADICKIGGAGFSTPLAIRSGERASQSQKGQQDEVYLSRMRTERVGKAWSPVDLWRVLRRGARGYWLHAG